MISVERMKRSFKERIKKILTILSTVVGLFVLIPQIAFAVEEDHNCTGNDCVVCEVIRTFEDNNKQMDIIDVPTIKFDENNNLGDTEYILLVSQFADIHTLIRLKTKLSS